jgi:hypothetical protein
MRVRFGRLPAEGLSAPSFRSAPCDVAIGAASAVAARFGAVFAAGAFLAGAFLVVDLRVEDFFRSAMAKDYAQVDTGA